MTTGIGVVTGCAITPNSPAAMNVLVAGGSALFDTTVVAVTGATKTISAADATFPRHDVVSIHSDGTLVVTAGTPSANPAVPATPTGDIEIGVVYVPANATAINNSNIGDRRPKVGVSTPAQVGLSPTARVAALTDSTTGTPAATLVAVRSDTAAHTAADANANFATLNAQIVALQAALIAAKILT